MAEIIPAILATSYRELVDRLDMVSGHAKTVQVDICDGGFVPSKTWPFLKGTNSEDRIFDEIVNQEQALPHWDLVDFEFDLMVRDAHSKIPDFVSAGATRVIVHKASVSDEELESVVSDYGKRSEELGPFDVELGIALMPSDDPAATAESLAPFVQGIHFVQVMGVANIGYQGQDFDPRAVELVRALRAAYPALPIAVDGGVSLENGRDLVNAGATRLVVGSALFESDDFLGTLKEFECL